METDAGAEDWKFFTLDENKSEISWNRSNHDLIGQVIFRPTSSPIVSGEAIAGSGRKCQWYRVISFTPSVKGEEPSREDVKQSQDPNAFDPNPIVARRM
eukprot:scaffold13972_cov20-Cyclotella_meneghiniana.AAC.1